MFIGNVGTSILLHMRLSSSVAKQRTVTRKISYFELGFFYFNSCVCYVTRGFIASTSILIY